MMRDDILACLNKLTKSRLNLAHNTKNGKNV